jgi:hypothetical protein
MAEEKFILIGWIAHGMENYKTDGYRALFNSGKIRVPPKIYRTEKIAARYGTPIPVYIKDE